VAAERTPRPARARRAGLVAAALALGTAVALGLAELGLRAAGFRPWHVPPTDTTVVPGGRFYAPHPLLGYTHIAGKFEVTLGDGYSFRVTHGPDTLRVTGPPAGDDGAPRPGGELWLFGCSLTHGWSLDDGDTWPWLLQERFPDTRVVNFGVGGYGTLQSLIQFREALRHGRPRLAVLAYASFHDARNTFLRTRRKEVAPYSSLGPLVQPYGRLDRDGRLRVEMADVTYREFPFMRQLALAHLAEAGWNGLEARAVPSAEVTRAIIAEMAALAKANGVDFAVAFIYERPFMTDFLRELGVPAVDMSVDLTVPGNTNEPHDIHPSARANRVYAQRLGAYLEPALRDAGTPR
jgi:lysophospholipase L1-like esterase